MAENGTTRPPEPQACSDCRPGSSPRFLGLLRLEGVGSRKPAKPSIHGTWATSINGLNNVQEPEVEPSLKHG